MDGRVVLTDSQRRVLSELARKYVWWKSPDEALQYPQRILLQVMNLGDWDDVLLVEREFDKESLRQLVHSAEAGQLNPRSWHFWHYRLRLAIRPEDVPPMPERRTG